MKRLGLVFLVGALGAASMGALQFERMRGSQAERTVSGTAGSPVTVTSGHPATRGAPKLGAWQPLPAGPFSGKEFRVSESVWTGTELLIHGWVASQDGIESSRAAAYNSAASSWRLLPPAPTGTYGAQCANGTVWTGTEMVTWGAGGAAFDPATNLWRRLPGAPIYGRGCPLMVWTGRQMIAWGGGCCGDAASDGAAYTPTTNSWEKLPAAPLAGRHPYGVWTGRELVVFGGADADGKRFTDGAAYDPSISSWRPIASMPAARDGASAVWDGTEILVVGGCGGFGCGRPNADGVAFNPSTNRWRRLPKMETSRVGQVAVWTGSQLLVWGGVIDPRAHSAVAPPHGIAYDPPTNRWSPLPVSPLSGRIGATAVWTGTTFIVWGGSSVGIRARSKPFTDGAAYTPAKVERRSRTSTKVSPADTTLAEFMAARMVRDAGSAEFYLSAHARDQLCENSTCIGLIGTSNPHYVTWEVLSRVDQGEGRVTFRVRIHEAVTGQGETTPQLETIEIGPGENYRGQHMDAVVLDVRQ